VKHVHDGNAVVYCQAAYTTSNGKTAHGLVRRTLRYRVLSVIDATCAGQDAGSLLDGKHRDIPVVADIEEAVKVARHTGVPLTHLVVGLAPDGGRLAPDLRTDMLVAIRSGLHVDSGLHDFLGDDPELRRLAAQQGVTIRDVRRPPPLDGLHFFSGKIEQVESLVIAVLGTDSAVGKRTTAWMLVEAMKSAGICTELVGTGQTTWMQGARFGLVLDSLPNDFVAGEIEHAVWNAWQDSHPDVIVIEGQGSLMHPAYPGGFEILAAARPGAVIMQHAPARRDYDGFPGYPVAPLETQIRAVELISGAAVVAVTVNHEHLAPGHIANACRDITAATGLPAFDVVLRGAAPLVPIVRELMPAATTSTGRVKP